MEKMSTENEKKWKIYQMRRKKFNLEKEKEKTTNWFQNQRRPLFLLLLLYEAFVKVLLLLSWRNGPLLDGYCIDSFAQGHSVEVAKFPSKNVVAN